MSRLIQEITVNEEEEATHHHKDASAGRKTAFRNSAEDIANNNNIMLQQRERKSQLNYYWSSSSYLPLHQYGVLGTPHSYAMDAATQFVQVSIRCRKGLGIKQVVLLFYFFVSRLTVSSECSEDAKMQFECGITNRFDFIAFNAISLVNSKSPPLSFFACPCPPW